LSSNFRASVGFSGGGKSVLCLVNKCLESGIMSPALASKVLQTLCIDSSTQTGTTKKAPENGIAKTT